MKREKVWGLCNKIVTIVVPLLLLTLLMTSVAFSEPIAEVQSASRATYKAKGSTTFLSLKNHAILNAGTTIRTSKKGQVRLLLTDGSQLTLGQNSLLELHERTTIRDKQNFFRALGGEVYARLKPGSAAATRTAVAGVRGTYILLQVNEADGATVLTVLEGSVDFFNEFGEELVKAGQQSSTSPGQAPTKPTGAQPQNLKPPMPPGSGQTLTGEGGLALIPTAIGMAPGTFSFSPSHFRLGKEKDEAVGRGGSTPPGDDDDDDDDDEVVVGTSVPDARIIAPAALLIAPAGTTDGSRFAYSGFPVAGRIGDHFEISGGISRLRVSGGASDGLTKTGINLGVKYLVNPEAREGDILWAVGTGYDRALLKNIRVYGVASKAFHVGTHRAPVICHLGIRYDSFDLDDIGGPKSHRVSTFAGTEIPLTRDGTFALTGEVQTKNNDFNEAKIPFAIGARYRPARSGFTVSAGYQRQGLISDSGFYAQVGYGF